MFEIIYNLKLVIVCDIKYKIIYAEFLKGDKQCMVKFRNGGDFFALFCPKLKWYRLSVKPFPPH